MNDEIKENVEIRRFEEKAALNYEVKSGYLCRKKKIKAKDNQTGKYIDGEIEIPLCNFTARIIEENVVDDGQESQHFFIIEGKLYDKIPLKRIEIPAEKFAGMTWILSEWGSKARIEAGQTIKDVLRHAIQTRSINAPVHVHFGHTGFREINGQCVYLHASGAIGSPPGSNVSVKLTKELKRYALPPYPLTQQERAADFLQSEKNALEVSFSFLDIGNRAITLPLFCLIFLAPLTTLLDPQPNFAFYLFGQSGTYKTTLALILLSHFGTFTSAESLSNFSDTKGILEKRSFVLKDTLHVIDDYHPSANRRAAESNETIAQQMIRNYSNRTARGRLNSDMSERGRYEPRGMLLVTAEELTALESTLARQCIVEVTEGAIDRTKLSAIQADVEKLPLAMASYVNWIRENMEEIKTTFPARFRELRERAANEGFHKKLPEQASFLGFALQCCTSFFIEKGILDQDTAAALFAEGWETFKLLAKQQQQRIEDDNPISLFFEIISVILIQGQARLDCMPGYDGHSIGSSEQVIGWYDANCIYLMKAAAWHVVQRRCIAENTHFPFSKATFFKMLVNKEIILPGKGGDTTHVMTIDKKSVRVIKIIKGGVYEKLVISVIE
jgi:hypothetical protein